MDGTVRSWGENSYGQLGIGSTARSSVPLQVTGLTGVKSMVAGFSSAYAVLTDGTLRSRGWNSYGQLGTGNTTDSTVPVPITGLAGVKTMASSYENEYALLTDGTVWTWGSNTAHRLGLPIEWSSSPLRIDGLNAITDLLK